MLLTLAYLILSPQTAAPELSLVYSDSLAPSENLIASSQRFWFTQPSEWSYADSVPDDGLGNPVPDSGPALTFRSTSSYRPRVRSPYSFALLRGHDLEGDFAVEVEAMQTGIETAHRDLVFVFGFQSPEQFYYCHLGAVPDASSSNVFEVSEAPRRRLADVSKKPIEWGRGVWHKLRLECTAGGRMRFFMDDTPEPHFEVELGRQPSGLVGFGSFDDAGAFKNLRVYATPSGTPEGSAPESDPGRYWKTSPFGSVEAGRGDSPIEFSCGKSKRSVLLLDADGDGVKGSKGDRWAVLSPSLKGELAPEQALPLDAAFITEERLAIQPVLDASGAFVAPYRFQLGAPSQSRSDFLRAEYDRRSEGHASKGAWGWSLDSWTQAEDTRPILIAITPHNSAESWRWDAELFADPEAMEALEGRFLLRRLDSSPDAATQPLVPLTAFLDGADRDPTAPLLVMLSAEGGLLGSASDLASPKALLDWLAATESVTPTQIRVRSHAPLRRHY